jgi:hypothetical protein
MDRGQLEVERRETNADAAAPDPQGYADPHRGSGPTISPSEALRRIGPGIASALPPGEHLDVWPMDPQSDVLPLVRRAGCQLVGQKMKKPWWQFWS